MPAPTNNQFFDLHFHLLFKNFLTKWESQYPCSRTADSLLGPVKIEHALWDKIDEWFLHFLDSQSCYQQVIAGGLKTGVIAIAPIERMFSSEEGFGKLLNDQVVTAPVDQTYLDKVRQGEISYYHLFLKELDLYRLLQKEGKIKLLRRGERKGHAVPEEVVVGSGGLMESAAAVASGEGLTTEIVVVKEPGGEQLLEQEGSLKQDFSSDSMNDTFSSEIPHLALSMEGGHGLCRTKIGKPGVPDIPHSLGVQDALYEDFIKDTELAPHISLKQLQQALWDEKLDLFCLTLTHLSHISEQHLATHAYGMIFLNNAAKYPVGYGISRLGEQVVHAAYTLKVSMAQEGVGEPVVMDAPVLIDVKHMSLKSRLDLYEYRKRNNVKLPLLATHMGVTGYSIEEWKEALLGAKQGKTPVPVVKVRTRRKEAGAWGILNKGFTFNPWTINLMDEDIVEVLNSGGLIGVSLDVRILGWQNSLRKKSDEYISPEEFHYFFPKIRVNSLSFETPDEDEGEEKEMSVAESYLLPDKEERHPLALCFNLLHIISVGKLYSNASNPWDQICIGSDYDGLIDPLKNCRAADSMPQLKGLLNKWLPIAEESYLRYNGGPKLLPKKGMEEIVDKVLYKNGQRFLQEWFSKKIDK